MSNETFDELLQKATNAQLNTDVALARVQAGFVHFLSSQSTSGSLSADATTEYANGLLDFCSSFTEAFHNISNTAPVYVSKAHDVECEQTIRGTDFECCGKGESVFASDASCNAWHGKQYFPVSLGRRLCKCQKSARTAMELCNVLPPAVVNEFVTNFSTDTRNGDLYLYCNVAKNALTVCFYDPDSAIRQICKTSVEHLFYSKIQEGGGEFSIELRNPTVVGRKSYLSGNFVNESFANLELVIGDENIVPSYSGSRTRETVFRMNQPQNRLQ
jgi:hypothetical protein